MSGILSRVDVAYGGRVVGAIGVGLRLSFSSAARLLVSGVLPTPQFCLLEPPVQIGAKPRLLRLGGPPRTPLRKGLRFGQPSPWSPVAGRHLGEMKLAQRS